MIEKFMTKSGAKEISRAAEQRALQARTQPCNPGKLRPRAENHHKNRYAPSLQGHSPGFFCQCFLRKPGTTLMRNLLAEWFFVDNNKIRNIWASMFYPTNDQPVPNWPPYEGNFPVAKEFAAPAAPAAAAPGRGAGGQ